MDPITKKQYAFPSLDDNGLVNLSVIVPAYFEEERCKKRFYFILYMNEGGYE